MLNAFVHRHFDYLPHFLQNAAMAPRIWVYVCELVLANFAHQAFVQREIASNQTILVP